MKKTTVYYIIEGENVPETFVAYETYKDAMKAFASVDDETAIITEITEEADGSSTYQVMCIKENLTNLKALRTAKGLSQSQLAELADVSLRAIQAYEQKEKDINKAQAGTLLKIARVLNCTIEDLLEHE